jgi:PilZ domain
MSFLDSSSNVGRQQSRCNVDRNSEVKGQFIFGPVDAPIVLPCALSDLSLDGCAVRLNSMLRSEPKIAIIRSDFENHMHLESAGRVCWVRQASIGSQTCGIKFRRPLSEEFLDQWIKQGLVNRRENSRDEVRQAVQMRTSAGGGSMSEALILDYSSSGVRIRSEIPLAMDERILLTLPDGRGIMLGVVWIANQEGQYFAGAQFANRLSSATLKDFFENHYQEVRPSKGGVMNFFKRCLPGSNQALGHSVR